MVNIHKTLRQLCLHSKILTVTTIFSAIIPFAYIILISNLQLFLLKLQDHFLIHVFQHCIGYDFLLLLLNHSVKNQLLEISTTLSRVLIIRIRISAIFQLIEITLLLISIYRVFDLRTHLLIKALQSIRLLLWQRRLHLCKQIRDTRPRRILRRRFSSLHIILWFYHHHCRIYLFFIFFAHLFIF